MVKNTEYQSIRALYLEPLKVYRPKIIPKQGWIYKFLIYCLLGVYNNCQKEHPGKSKNSKTSNLETKETDQNAGALFAEIGIGISTIGKLIDLSGRWRCAGGFSGISGNRTRYPELRNQIGISHGGFSRKSDRAPKLKGQKTDHQVGALSDEIETEARNSGEVEVSPRWGLFDEADKSELRQLIYTPEELTSGIKKTQKRRKLIMAPNALPRKPQKLIGRLNGGTN